MCCRAAVERCYAELCARSEPPLRAREAALIIFRYHHPEVPLDEAASLIEMWTRDTVH